MTHQKNDVRMVFDYTNHKGETERRITNPMGISFRSMKPWYPEPTWLMRAYDYDRHDYRDFQLCKMRNIEEIRA